MRHDSQSLEITACLHCSEFLDSFLDHFFLHNWVIVRVLEHIHATEVVRILRKRSLDATNNAGNIPSLSNC